MKLLDGRKASQAIKDGIKGELQSFGDKKPGLAVILVGDDPASQVYVKYKHKGCEEVGINSEIYRLPADTKQVDIIAKIEELNNRKEVHGILVQLPLPKHMEERTVLDAVSPEKDVDGFHAVNVGHFFLTAEETFAPCTPRGIIHLLKYHGIEIKGKDAVIVGRSNIVGKPLAILMLKENATVTWCHTKTKDLKAHTKRADILVAAAGSPGLITADMVKNGAVVVDVGMNRLPDGKLCGDVDFENVAKKAYAISPVPGGVGPMTIAMLLQNTLNAFKRHRTNA
jgi:methylenetetrahydrofolate dehydrogenase (NADP+)/methenyltetrahydrofolate cyclohydrolase